MSMSISFKSRFTLLNEHDPLSIGGMLILRMANETLVLIQDIIIMVIITLAVFSGALQIKIKTVYL